MGHFVPIKVSGTCAAEVTVRASKRLFSSMCPNVHLKGASVVAGVATGCATEWPFFCMGPYMFRESATTCTRVIALFAVERLFS